MCIKQCERYYTYLSDNYVTNLRQILILLQLFKLQSKTDVMLSCLQLQLYTYSKEAEVASWHSTHANLASRQTRNRTPNSTITNSDNRLAIPGRTEIRIPINNLTTILIHVESTISFKALPASDYTIPISAITRETNQASPVKNCLQNQCLYFHILHFKNNISTSYLIDHCFCPYLTIQNKLVIYKLPHTSGKTWQIPGFVFMNG